MWHAMLARQAAIATHSGEQSRGQARADYLVLHPVSGILHLCLDHRDGAGGNSRDGAGRASHQE